MIDMHAVMQQLAKERPVFHSEADFQHAVAWLLHRDLPGARVRLEYRPFPKESVYVDVWLEDRSERIALELKYFTRRLEVSVDGEAFDLRNRAAQPVNRYQAVKDIARVERIARQVQPARGAVVVLTNHAVYWRKSARDTIDRFFQLHDGRQLTGSLAWGEKAGPGTMKNVAEPLNVVGHYALAWRDYSTVGETSTGRFRYLLLEVLPQSGIHI